MNRTYLDHSATTPVRREVFEAMVPYLTYAYGNPSSIHSMGREIRADVDVARERVAAAIGARPSEIIFTAGGSEADNLAIIGLANMQKTGKNHIITSCIEHHAVLDTVKYLEKCGFEVTLLPVDCDGMVDPEDVRRAITPQTFLVSVMHANNEIGTIQPIEEIAEIAHCAGALMHTDAVQTVGHIPVNVNDLKVDMLSMSGHKFYGPKGVGALYLKQGVKVQPIIHGGSQERKRRAGTENVAGIVGMGFAIQLAIGELDNTMAHEAELTRKLINGVMLRIPDTRLNGHPEKRLANNANFSFSCVEGESLLLKMDMLGICASSGSACTSGSLEPSHVLLAIGLPHELAHGSVRFSIGRGTKDQDIDYVLESLPPIVASLREMSPIYYKSECNIKNICDNPCDCTLMKDKSGCR